MSTGQESPVLEKQELHQSSRVERRSQGVRTGPQEGGDALRLLGTLTDTCAPERMHHTQRPSSLKGCSACSAGPGSSSEGLGGGASAQRVLRSPGAARMWLWQTLHMGGAAQPQEQLGGCSCRGRSSGQRGLHSWECESNSAGPGAQEAGITSQDPASPRDRQKPGRHRTARMLLTQAEQISGPTPEHPGPCRPRAP